MTQKYYHYKIKITYQGTNYFGLQSQKLTAKNQQQLPTIQDEILQVLAQMSKSDDLSFVASGRTDAGVHALGQICKITLPIYIPPLGLLKGLNSLLPKDIRILEAETCEENFHPIFHSKWKEYLYYFYTGPESFPLVRQQITHYPYPIKTELINSVLPILEGTFDFQNFQCTGTPVKSTIRTIYQAQLKPIKMSSGLGLPFIPNCYQLSFVGDGFLKQMVRLLVGTLWEIGREKVSPEDLKYALSGQKMKRQGSVAPPQGLYLSHVEYKHNYSK